MKTGAFCQYDLLMKKNCSNIDVIYIVKYQVASAISLAVSRGHLAIHCHLKKLLLLTKKANKLNLLALVIKTDDIEIDNEHLSALDLRFPDL